MLIYRQVFKNKNGSTGILHLVCNDPDCNAKILKAICKERWKVEVFHKALKSNVLMAKSPVHTVRTQSNHIFLSIYSAFRLEVLSLKVKLNHFQPRAKIYMAGLKASLGQLRELSAA